ncbi:hypothetical protein MPS_1647 [Mycobacterium pseudoshottsii JCM 15466]|nr:hypothetical protein [Mycobacterium pseudoshottsii]GAQ33433.1 hypothetical protein MPS_1647 [Mycobacterium pseudoshottsii JCM 15466]
MRDRPAKFYHHPHELVLFDRRSCCRDWYRRRSDASRRPRVGPSDSDVIQTIDPNNAGDTRVSVD